MKKILVALPLTEDSEGIFLEYREKFITYCKDNAEKVRLDICDKNKLDEQAVWDYDAVIGNIPSEKLNLMENLRWFQTENAGTDGIIEAVRRHEGVVLTNATGAFGSAIAEYMLSVILMMYKKLNVYRDYQQAHIWLDEGGEQSIFGKNVLVVGTGDIGTSFAKIMRPFSPYLVGLNRRGVTNESFDITDTVEHMDKYIGQADIVCMCVPKNAQTNHLLSKERIGRMKKNAVLVNVGRSNSVDMEALSNALLNDEIFGATLDVFDEEPIPADSLLWDIKRLVITPHVAGKTYGHLGDTSKKSMDICFENMVRYCENRPLINVVDLDTGYKI